MMGSFQNEVLDMVSRFLLLGIIYPFDADRSKDRFGDLLQRPVSDSRQGDVLLQLGLARLVIRTD